MRLTYMVGLASHSSQKNAVTKGEKTGKKFGGSGKLYSTPGYCMDPETSKVKT